MSFDSKSRPVAPHRWAAPEIEDKLRPDLVFAYVTAIEERQSDIRLQMFKNAYLYTGEELDGLNVDWQRRAPGRPEIPRINVVQSVIETANSRIATRKPRLACRTIGGDWKLRQKARGMEQFLDGTFKKMKFTSAWQRSFSDGASLGTGVAKLYKYDGDISIDRIFPPEIVVDERACATTEPRAIFQRRFPDVDELAAEYDDKKLQDAIWRASSDSPEPWVSFSTRAPYTVPVIDAYRASPRPGIPGMHLVCIPGTILSLEPWDLPFLPFITFRWLKKITGWYGIGIPEVVYFLQARVNRHAAFEAACQNRAVSPAVIVDGLSDGQLSESTTNDVGQIIPSFGRFQPQFITPPQVPPEIYSDEERKIKQIYAITGVSEFSAGAKNRPPTGLDSDPALEEWIQYTEGRFAAQEGQYDQGYLDGADVTLEIAKELAAEGKMPKATWDSPRHGLIGIKWSDVDMKRDVFELRIDPASSTSQTPAGLRQRIEDERAAGRMADDLYRYFVQTLDVESYFNLYDAALSNLMRTISQLEDESAPFPAPSPYQALELGLWLVQMELNKIEALEAPPKILRRLSIWMEQADALKTMGAAPNVGTGPALGPAQVGGAPVAGAAGTPPGIIMGGPGVPPPPMLGPAQAGGSPQAPQLAPVGRLPVPGLQ